MRTIKWGKCNFGFEDGFVGTGRAFVFGYDKKKDEPLDYMLRCFFPGFKPQRRFASEEEAKAAAQATVGKYAAFLMHDGEEATRGQETSND